ncbi:MAG: RIP metalloprotease RseP [Chloroflexi bacterium]|nr:RIP metalloprotease RseP [Chloroflexota bacterium]
MILTIIAFIAVLSLLVFVHELGHFLLAKRAGVPVEEFGFGFPPRLLVLGRHRETIFTINAIPLGGFVRMPGENDPYLPGGFASQSPAARASILVAGAGMNLLLAIFLFGLSAFIGEPVPATTEVVITEVAPGSPAESAGLQPGDTILALNGQEIEDSQDLVDLTEDKLGQEVVLTVRRGEETLDLALTPRPNPPPGEGPMGIAVETVVISTKLESHPIWEAIPLGVERTLRALWVIIRGIILMVQGLIAPELAGPIGIAQITGEVAQMGLPFLIQFTAFLSVNLALLNLLPFPGLDGGRLAFVLVEILRGGKRMDPQREGLIHFIGIAILLGLVIIVSYFDILRVTSG